MLRQFFCDRRGATAIEYGLIVAVLSLAIIAGVGAAGGSLQNMFAETNRQLDAQ